MSVAIIDAREWQNMFDLRTGAKITEDSPVSRLVKGVQARHPYPGDMDAASNRWVSDVALDLIDKYDPGFVFLTYAQQYFLGRYSVLSGQEWADAVSALKEEVERFVRVSGFFPVIVGTGDITPFVGFIDVTRLHGLVLSTHWSARYGGLHEPSFDDLKRLNDMPQIERIVPRGDFIRLFPEA